MKKLEPLNIRFMTNFSRCNYSCEYCIAGHANAISKESKFDDEKIISITRAIEKLPFIKNIRIGIEGEFFLSKTLIKCGEILSNSRKVKQLNLITNLSLPFSEYVLLLKNYSKKKVGIVASFHPSQVKDVEQWTETALKIKEITDFSVVLVGYPPHIFMLKDLVNFFERKGIYTTVQGYIGNYKGLEYPTNYSYDEKALIKSLTKNRIAYEYWINCIRPGLCNAGYRSIYIDHLGDVYNCDGVIREKLFNICNSNNKFFLYKNARPCLNTTCLCDTNYINTVLFDLYYEHVGINQQKYLYKYRDLIKENNLFDEWEVNI